MKKYGTLLVIIYVIFMITSCTNTTEAKKRLATPTFDPPGMIYTAIQHIEISCSIEDVTIRYTTDGKDPTDSSPEYIDPVEIVKTTILKARAFMEGWEKSEVVSARYIIPEMVFVPGGTFTMGDTRGEGYDDEKPTYEVTLSDFYIGNYPVTQQEWIEIMSDNPSRLNNMPEHPVEQVNWYATLVYCNKRSMIEGLEPVYRINNTTNPDNWGTIPTNSNEAWDAVIADWETTGYRLATEAEWEYAARGGTNAPDYLYSGSNSIDEVAWYSGNSADKTQPVGLKLPNSLEIYDMSGNVYEWVWDWRDLYNVEAKNNPRGPATGTMRVERGGSWTQLAVRCRVSSRNHAFPRHGNHHRGFRVVRKASL